MLKNFDRDDLVKLWSLVHERFNSTEPTEDKERELWVELKRLFKPDDDDTLWKLQRSTRMKLSRADDVSLSTPFRRRKNHGLDKLNEGTIEIWDELQTAFISRFFPSALFNRLLGEIRAFS
ncbi:hypothetical protein Tco_0435891 [Tanacetum coccineum]